MNKPAHPKEDILESAYRLASVTGMAGLSIGRLAKEVGMSKSGLFAHFGSKEKLQLELLHWVEAVFGQQVILPAIELPRGVPRLRGLFQLWLDWHLDLSRTGGCLFVSSVAEFDDQPGPVRELLQDIEHRLLDSIERVVAGAIREKHFREDTDPAQFTFEFYSIFIGFSHFYRLLDDNGARKRLERGFERLVQANLAQYQGVYANER